MAKKKDDGPKMGRPRKFKEARTPVTLREEPSIQAKIIKKYKSLQKFWDEKVTKEFRR